MTDTTGSVPDRSQPPAPGTLRPFDFPATHRAELSNGIPVLTARASRFPVVTFSVLLEAGGVREIEDRAGLASLTADLLDAGAGERSGADIAEHVEGLGADLDVASSWDVAHVGVSALRTRIEPSLAILADLIRAPTFPLDEVDRLRGERHAELLQRRASPRGLANEMALRFIYSESSPFARALSGSIESVASITQSDIREFHASHYVGGGASMLVVGDIEADEAMSLAERFFGDWDGAAPATQAEVPVAPRSETVQLVVVDRPGAVQSEIRVGHVGADRTAPDYFALAVMNSILGGAFSSRLNLNLRERHGFTYGVHSSFALRRRPGPFLVSTAVETAVTQGALREILREIAGMRDSPVTQAELDDARSYLAGAFPLRLQTTHGIASRLAETLIYRLPDDYFDTYRERVLAVSAEDVLQVAQRRLRPDALAIVVVGDASAVRGPLEELDLGPVRVVDVEGNEKP
jgi:zinc protease